VKLERLEFSRTGGFAGLTLSTEVEHDDPELAQVSGLLSGVDLPALATSTEPTAADRFIYLLVLETRESRYEVTIGERELPEPLEPVVRLLLDRARRR